MLEPIRMARLALLLLLCAPAPLAHAGNTTPQAPAQQAGLMWNRSGLPAVFPLQIKTSPGQDYFMTLHDAETGDAALAAFVEGGAFFKVLVPPGVFHVTFAAGTDWQGEDGLFGPGAHTHHFELQTPLTFETRGLGTKAGHIVDLSDYGAGQTARITLKDQLICQSFRLRPAAPDRPALYQAPERDILHPPGQLRSGLAADPEGGFPDRSGHRRDDDRPFTFPRYDLQSRYCG